jgi:hypothetical protein
MAQVGWERWAKPASVFLTCLKTTRANAYAGGSGVSATRLNFPNIGSFSAAFRVVFQSSDNQREFQDTILIAAGRARIELIVTSLLSIAPAISSAEARLGAVLVARASAGAA